MSKQRTFYAIWVLSCKLMIEKLDEVQKFPIFSFLERHGYKFMLCAGALIVAVLVFLVLSIVYITKYERSTEEHSTQKGYEKGKVHVASSKSFFRFFFLIFPKKNIPVEY